MLNKSEVFFVTAIFYRLVTDPKIGRANHVLPSGNKEGVL